MIKAIIFDCFGVLTGDHWKEFVASLPPEQVEEARALNRAYDANILSKNEFLSAIESLTGNPPSYVESLLDKELSKNSNLLSYITMLKNDYKIGLLSNIASDWVTAKFLSEDEQRLFDAMVFSYEIGASKPDTRAYKAICDKLEVDYADCVFVDDSEGYCIAARELGMQAILYKDFEQMKAELDKILNDSKS